MKSEATTLFNSFEDYSHKLRKHYSSGYKNYIWEYEDCANNCIILPGSFERLISKLDGRAYTLISAFNPCLNKPENITRNRKIRKLLSEHNIGVYHLVVTSSGGKNSDIINDAQRIFLAIKPEDMTVSDFEGLTNISRLNVDLFILGVECPDSISGRRIYSENLIKYCF